MPERLLRKRRQVLPTAPKNFAAPYSSNRYKTAPVCLEDRELADFKRCDQTSNYKIDRFR
jgi:hypothetical protein